MSSSIPGVGDDSMATTIRSRAGSTLMQLHSYDTPSSEALLQLGRQRHFDGGDARRLLITEALAAAVFLVGAGALAVLASPARSFSIVAVVVTVLAYLAA